MTSRASLWVVLMLLACAAPSPTLEQQADRSDLRKRACTQAPALDYEPAPGTEGLVVEAVDCGLAYPSSIAIAPDGSLAFVAQLKGLVYVYEKVDGRFEPQGEPFHDLGDLGVSDEAGLTGVTLAPRFDLDADAAPRRDVFLALQLRTGDGTMRNRVQRVTAARRDGRVVATDARTLFTGDTPSAQAHQIHGGVAFERLGETYVLFPVGHAYHGPHDDDALTSSGTLFVMSRDGEPPPGPHPWPARPHVRAIGLRNAYGLEALPEMLDPAGGIIGFENGDHDSDRAWLVHPFGSSDDTAYRLDLGYAGDDGSNGWSHIPDPAIEAEGTPRNAVFKLWKPVVAPTAVSLHRGAGMIPPSDERGVSLVAALFGRSGTNDLGPGKSVELVRLRNVREGTLQADSTLLVQRSKRSFGEFRHPVGLDVDDSDGDIYFADIISGVLYRVRVEEP